ncbi:protein LURP-one-related 6 [Amborella trichopoda]|uniref:Tubby C-terminal domain-containing protein n=1 Tax=Amborella trichopoda TaxID=13333 RepID=W1PTC5_AMBTC|nr:protein LURP-one-related 6 [Amborella trichopoda]ERN11293.1 hypothetical protein AMTR_s00024p00242840 [Amborella trichopoda]|eukprot:XP_006849712.1 protein LURP-one-related 6 [Amborella trichopoda]
MGSEVSVRAIISKEFCSKSEVILNVRKRPNAINGGGLIVRNCSQEVAFRVDGCGTLGLKNQLIVKDASDNSLLLIRKQGGVVQALSFYNKWKGYSEDYEGTQKPVFSIREAVLCFSKRCPIRIYMEGKHCTRDWDFEIQGSFSDRDCVIKDHNGTIVAQVGVTEDIVKTMLRKDVYYVVVQPGFDQAFVLGVIAVLDNMFDGATRC